MKIYLTISDTGLISSVKTPRGPDHYFNGLEVLKDAAGWYHYSHIVGNHLGDYLNIENQQLSAEIQGDCIFTEGYFIFLKADKIHFRIPGIYTPQDSIEIIVMDPDPSGSQVIKYRGKSFNEIKNAFVALRNGELLPKYPLSRPQNAPTYEALTELVTSQSKIIDKLNDNLAFANVVLNSAQKTIFEAGDACRALTEELQKVRQQLAGNSIQ